MYSLLGGPCVVMSGVISPLIQIISIVTVLITPLITTHKPPSNQSVCVSEGLEEGAACSPSFVKPKTTEIVTYTK